MVATYPCSVSKAATTYKLIYIYIGLSTESLQILSRKQIQKKTTALPESNQIKKLKKRTAAVLEFLKQRNHKRKIGELFELQTTIIIINIHSIDNKLCTMCGEVEVTKDGQWGPLLQHI